MILRHAGAVPVVRRARERGETLLELMATVVLMGTAVIGLISAMFALTTSSQQFRRTSDANLAVHAYAEALKGTSAPVDTNTVGSGTYQYIACAGFSPAIGTYPGFSDHLRSGFTASIVSIEYWDGTTDASGALNWSSSSCTRTQVPGSNPAIYEDKGLQRITVVVSSNTAGQHFPVSEKITLVKRDTRCLYTYSNATSGPC